MEVLKLQQRVEDVKYKSGNQIKGLKDVCHQPLAPEKDECNIQNIWSYWQDDIEEFKKNGISQSSGHNDTYLDHFLLCIRNPTLQVRTKLMDKLFVLLVIYDFV